MFCSFLKLVLYIKFNKRNFEVKLPIGVSILPLEQIYSFYTFILEGYDLWKTTIFS